MLYMVGKIFPYKISFKLVYNESGHKNMKKVEKLFLHRVQEKVSIILKQRWRGIKQQCVVTHTYIYQI